MKSIERKRTTFTFVRRRDGYVEASFRKQYKNEELTITQLFMYYTKKEIVSILRKKMREDIQKFNYNHVRRT